MAVRVRNELSIRHPNAAGIDIGGSNRFVAVPQDRSEMPVREFGCYTQDLYELLSRSWFDKALLSVAEVLITNSLT